MSNALDVKLAALVAEMVEARMVDLASELESARREAVAHAEKAERLVGTVAELVGAANRLLADLHSISAVQGLADAVQKAGG